MGILDDAIREHLELKRKHGVSEEELQRQQEEALGPARREVAQQPDGAESEAEGAASAAASEGAASTAVEETPLFDGEQPGAKGADKPAEVEPPPAAQSPAAAEPPAAAESPAAAEPPMVSEPAAAAEPASAEPASAEPAAVPEPPALEREPPSSEAPALVREPAEPLPAEPPTPAEPPAAAEPPVADHTGMEPPPEDAPEVGALEPDSGVVLGDTEPHGFPAVEDDEQPDDVEDLVASEPEDEELDVLEDTPDFLQETPEHDRLWFEQKPPRDFDFD